VNLEATLPNAESRYVVFLVSAANDLKVWHMAEKSSLGFSSSR
jgi:hypothetical protein